MRGKDSPRITGLLVIGRNLPLHEEELRERRERYKALEGNWHTLWRGGAHA